MNRMLCLILVLCLFLPGCALFGERIREPVTFYYLRAEYRYGSADGVIAPEVREASDHVGDLSYLMALYLMGPSDEELVSPIPRGTRIYSAVQENNTVTLTLSDASQTLTDSEFSLACACLTMTCLEITGADKVNIASGDRSVTMTRDNLTLFDDSAAAAATEETQ